MRYLQITLVTLFLAACSTGETIKTTPEDDFTGRYTLVSLDGASMPAKITHAGTTLVLRSGVFTINADGTCRSETVFIPAGHGAINRDVRCSYTREGSKMVMQWEGAGFNTGTLGDGTFTMNNEGMMFEYRKQ